MKTMKNMKQSRFILFVLSFLVMSVGNVYAQNVTVTGTVLDSTGEPVIGANVKVAGKSSIGTITDFEGNFSLSVPADTKKLEISYIGMLSQEAVIKPGTPVKVILKEDTEELDEVVVIGYGTVKKRDLTGSMTSIKQADIIAVPTTNALESLQGKVAGLDMTKSSGQTGSGLSFSIRGNRSLNASNAPLIIVDGVPYGTDIDINPNVIESMEILKDASSTAIYGSRGANGVILITTKKGAVGKTKVSYNGYYSINSVAAYPDRMNLSEWADFKREAYRTDGQWGGPEDDAKIFGSAYDAVKSNQNVDWVDMLMQTGSQMSHSVNISNGTEKTTFNLAFEYMSEDGLVKMDDMDRYNATLSLSHKLTDNLKLNANVVYTYLDQNIRRDPFNRSIYYAPYGDVYNEDGSINVLPFNDGQTISPIAEEVPGAYKNNRLTSHLVGNVGATWNIIKDLTLTSTFGFDKKDIRTGHFADTYTLDGAGNYSLADATNHSDVNWSWENTLAYSFTLGKHNLSLMAGNALYKNVAEEYKGAGHNLISSTMLFYNLGGLQDSQQISSSYVQTTMASFFGRINYKFNEKYLMTVTLRQDGSSVLAKDHQWGVFPSVALAWRMSEESFLKGTHWLDNLKLRLSYGVTGNNNVDDYVTIATASGPSYVVLGGSEIQGYYPNGLVNTGLIWEKVKEFDLGLDFSVLSNRINLTADFYHRLSDGQIMDRIVPVETGETKATFNVGSVRNTGIELGMQFGIIRSKDFIWDLSVNYSRNWNKILELSNGKVDEIASNRFIGEPLNVLRDYIHTDVITDKGVTMHTKDGDIHYTLQELYAKYGSKYKWYEGQIAVNDWNNDGKITDEDKQIYGCTDPKWVGSLSSNMYYKGFDFSVMIYTKQGQWARSYFHDKYMKWSDRGNQHMAMDFYIPKGAPVIDHTTGDIVYATETHYGEYPYPNNSDTSAGGYFSDKGSAKGEGFQYQKTSFVKVKNICLGYTFPKKWITKAGLQHLRLYINVLNPFCFTDYDGFDPEWANAKLTDGGPASVTYQIGANIKF